MKLALLHAIVVSVPIEWQKYHNVQAYLEFYAVTGD